MAQRLLAFACSSLSEETIVQLVADVIGTVGAAAGCVKICEHLQKYHDTACSCKPHRNLAALELAELQTPERLRACGVFLCGGPRAEAMFEEDYCFNEKPVSEAHVEANPHSQCHRCYTKEMDHLMGFD